MMELAELILEDGPQFIIQSVNNDLTGKWSALAIISVVVEALLVIRLSWEILWKKFKMDKDFWSGEIFDNFIVQLPACAPAAPENAVNPVQAGVQLSMGQAAATPPGGGPPAQAAAAAAAQGPLSSPTPPRRLPPITVAP